MSIVGMQTPILLRNLRRFAQPFQIVREQVSYVLYPELEHCKPVNSYSPCNCLPLYSEVFQNLGPEHSGSSEFDPAKSRVLCRELHRRLGERVIVRNELHFLRARDFARELLKYSKKVGEVEVFADNEPVGLVEFNQMCRIQNVGAKAPCNREIFS